MPLTAGHNLQLLHGGAEFFPSLVAAIDGAEQEVWLETYIFYFDASGERVAAALERAALRGVVVYLVVDGIGTPVVPVEWVQRAGLLEVQTEGMSAKTVALLGVLVAINATLRFLDVVLPGPGGRVAEELRHADQQLLEQQVDFLRIGLQIGHVVGNAGELVDADAALDPPINRALLVKREVMPALRAQQDADFLES